MITKIPNICCLGFLLSAPALSAPLALPGPNPDPDQASIVTEDIDRFWEAFDQAVPTFPAEILQKIYLDRGTPGLQDFIKLRIQSADKLGKKIQTHSRYYASIRESTRRIPEMKNAIRASFYALEYLYPDAVFPNVYFVIGIANTGGTTSERGLLIGAEMYGRTPQTPTEELNHWLKSVLAPVESVLYIVDSASERVRCFPGEQRIRGKSERDQEAIAQRRNRQPWPLIASASARRA